MHLVLFVKDRESADMNTHCQALGIPIDVSTSPIPDDILLNDKKGVYWEGIGEGKDMEKQVLETLAFITYLMENHASFPAVGFPFSCIFM